MPPSNAIPRVANLRLHPASQDEVQTQVVLAPSVCSVSMIALAVNQGVPTFLDQGFEP